MTADSYRAVVFEYAFSNRRTQNLRALVKVHTFKCDYIEIRTVKI